MFASLLLGVYLGTHQQPTVSLELRGVRLENAAPILAKVFGMDSLQIGPTLKNDVILVRTKDVDPEILKANLAKTLNGTWLHRTEGWWFTQTDIQKDSEQKLYDKARYKFFTEIVEKSKKKLAATKPLDEAACKQILKDLKAISSSTVNRFNNNIWRRYQKIDDQGPMRRLANRIALRITPDVWMKLTEQNPRIVFCNRPNSMQQPFPIRVDDLFALAIEEQNVWSTYAGTDPLRGPNAGEENSWYYMGEMNEHRQPLKMSDFGTFTMTVELTNQSIEFNAYDAKGKSTLSTSVNSYEYSDEDQNYNYKDEYEKQMKMAVTVTGDAAEYLDLISPKNPYGRREKTKKPISSSLLAKLLHPETIDPLSISAPDIYLSSIQTPNVVMVMNDYQRAARFAEFKNPRFSRSMPSTISDSNGWFIYSQPNPVASRKIMPDRKRLGQTLRYINANKRPLNLEEQANLAYDLPWESESSDAYRAHIEPLQPTEVESYNNRSALRIYGSMNGGERERAKKGGVPFSILSDGVKREIFRAMFFVQKYESQIQMDWNNMSNRSQAQQRQMSEMQNLLYGGIYEEKTFVLPNGLTNDLMLTIEDNSTNNLYCGRPEIADGENYYGGGRSMSASTLGDYLFKLTNPQKYRYEVQNYERIDENDIHLASQRSLTIKLKLNNILYVQWSLTQTLLTDPKTYNSKNLPQNIMDEIKKAYDQAQKNDLDPNRRYYPGPPTKVNPPPR